MSLKSTLKIIRKIKRMERIENTFSVACLDWDEEAKCFERNTEFMEDRQNKLITYIPDELIKLINDQLKGCSLFEPHFPVLRRKCQRESNSKMMVFRLFG